MSVRRRAGGKGQRAGWLRSRPAARCPLPTRNALFGQRFGQFVLFAALIASSGCEWFTDFKRQPSVVTWESWPTDSALRARGAPQGSIPIDGTAMPGFMISYAPQPATIDSLAAIPNPVPVTEASLANGRMHFQINCAVCHGDNADGQTPNGRFGLIPIPLVGDLTKARTDGYIFGMIRNGRASMPSYNRIEERDRWDVVNYIRALQGVVTGIPFERGPLARPGVTGDKVPGPSTLGPNRAIPYRPTAAEGATRPGGDR